MSRILSILFVAALAGGIIYNVYQVGYYLVNQEEVIALFCINKEKPELKCNGKCHLADQLLENKPSTDNNDGIIPAPILALLLGVPVEQDTETFPSFSLKNRLQIYFTESFVSKIFLDVDSPPPNSLFKCSKVLT